ncbi:3'-5' exonuclease [Phaeobacter inhibens]|uniref:3'-5' exonuclease n=1 Tax=Phaeobacter inhibens TaxID=221822 RepID=UPI0021A95741|nr:hypothetical protein [Phaeobacter inhibens]UWR55513.1 hypothetical protein K4F89_10595 [Phaeobacter inhibens]
MSEKRFKFSDRATEKAKSRARDEDRLKAGEVSPAELRKENSFFMSSGFANKKIGFSPKCRPENGDKYFMADPCGCKPSPVFIDFEASSLSVESWPIEVGIAWLEGKRVISDSKLIRPRSEWPEDDWNPVSEEVHGILRADLDGANSADDVASWLLEAIAGRTLVSDAPEFDQRWLDRLLGGPGPQIDDFDRVLWMAFSHEDGTIAPGRLNKAYKNRLTRRTIHRAGDDAAGLCYAWRAGLGK